MAHTITPAPSSAVIVNHIRGTPSLGFHGVRAQFRQDSHQILQSPRIKRRAISLGLAASLLSFNLINGDVANAARRPPPPPPEEKTDPNLSGLQAKVLASKKRKEAMKQAMEKLREKGKSINKTPPSTTPEAQ